MNGWILKSKATVSPTGPVSKNKSGQEQSLLTPKLGGLSWPPLLLGAFFVVTRLAYSRNMENEPTSG